MTSRVLALVAGLLASAALLAAIEVFHGALFASPPEGMWAHGVPAELRQVRMAAVYGGFAREAAEGGGLFLHNHHTAEPHAAALARPKEWVVGRTLAWFGIGSLNALRVERAFAVPVFVLGVQVLGATLLLRRRSRLALTAGACLGGTLYWLPPRIPWLAERPGLWRAWLGPAAGGDSGLGYGYAGQLIGAPHLALEIGFFALAVGLGIRAARARDARLSFAAGVALLLLCAVRPYTVPIALASCLAAELPNLGRARGAARVGRRASLARLVLVALPPAPLLLHLASVLRGDTVFASLDVVHPAPPTHELLLFIGVPAVVLPLLALRLWRAGVRPSATPGATAILAWTTVQLLLIHGAPWIQWEVEPLHPLLLLVLLGCIAAFERLGVAVPALVAFVALHALGGAAWVGELWERRDEADGGLYLPLVEYEALSHLDQTRPEDALTADRPPVALICSEFLGPMVPWLAGVRVTVGHRDHTPERAVRSAAQRRLMATGEGLEAARRAGATHLLVGPREGPRTRRWIAGHDGLRVEWARDGASVLRLLGPTAPDHDGPSDDP